MLVWGRRPSLSRGVARTPGLGSRGIPESRGDAHICPEWTVMTRNTESGHTVSAHLLIHQGASPEVCSTAHKRRSPFLSSRKWGDETVLDMGADDDCMGSGHAAGGREPQPLSHTRLRELPVQLHAEKADSYSEESRSYTTTPQPPEEPGARAGGGPSVPSPSWRT